jgi:hypothetical protein
MDDKLLGIVLGRLEKYPLADEPADLLLAALKGKKACWHSSVTRRRGVRPLIRPVQPRRSLRARICSR